MQTNLQWKKANQWLLGGGGEGRRNHKEAWGNLGVGGDEYIQYLDCGDNFTGVYVRQN